MEVFNYHFPMGAVQCEPGDTLAERDGELRYRVEDIVVVQKLYRVAGEAEPIYFEAEPLLDSVGPQYPDEIHLLLTIAGSDRPTPPTGAQADALTVRTWPILRAASAMSAERWLNLGKTPSTDAG